ncbi:MAG: DUF2791 family P-loop domain-containing protein, partial [Anaerolineales bacterium]|nr:DUF2791 family P-loop domain-containing protein [Anaerolineales bacterium]
GGEIDQFRGDGLVAFFGARSAHEDDPERAILAALAMQDAFKSYVAKLKDKDGLGDLALRVGVNTGELIATTIGNKSHYKEDTAMGEAIAIAARMETAAEPGTVLVSENTYRLAESKFEWEALGDIMVKGVSHPIAVYHPLKVRLEAAWLNEPASFGHSLPMIGRQREFEALKRKLEGLYQERGGIAIVTGERGMGKSFLVAQVRQHFIRREALLARVRQGAYEELSEDEKGEVHQLVKRTPAETQQKEINWLRGRCRSYRQDWPFSMWLDLLQSWLGVRPEESEEETLRRLREHAQDLWGDRMVRYYPYMATLMSLPLEEEYLEHVKYLDAENLKEQFYRTIWNWTKALAENGPLALTFADLQWVNNTSLDLLKYCLPLCDTHPILFLVVYRPERTSPAWEFRHFVETEFPHRLTEVPIPPLSRQESRQWIEELIGPEVLSQQAKRMIEWRAAGNPYYIRELIESLIAQGTLVQEPDTGKWHATQDITSVEMPDSLQSLLLARIDRLGAQERQVLQIASVIGNVFWDYLLEAVAEEVDNIRKHLTNLQRDQLIVERGRLQDLGVEYAFQSPMMREVAYESLLNAQRVVYHQRTAECLESCFGVEEPTRYYGALAYHYRQARDVKKELLYAIKAGDVAREVYANWEAIDHYNRALELLDQLEAQSNGDGMQYAIQTQRFEVLSNRSDLNYLVGNVQTGTEDAKALLELANEIEDDPALRIDAHLRQYNNVINNLLTRDEIREGVRTIEEMLALARDLDDKYRQMLCQALISSLKFKLQENDWVHYAERAGQLARELGDKHAEVRYLIGMANAYGIDNLDRALDYVEAAYPLVKEIDDKEAEMDLLYMLGSKYERSGNYHKYLTEYEEERLRISRETGYRYIEAAALMFCGQIRSVYLGDYEHGLQLEEEAYRIWQDSPSNKLFPALRIAQVQIELGDMDKAKHYLDKVEPLLPENTLEEGRAGYNLVKAMYHNAISDKQNLYESLRLMDEINRMVDEEGVVSRQYKMAAATKASYAHLWLGKILDTEEQRNLHAQQALECSGLALDLYHEFGFTQIVECVSEEILYQHNLALAANGQRQQAKEFIRQAYAEMMRKYELVPAESEFRHTYLDHIRLHRDIQSAYSGEVNGQ